MEFIKKDFMYEKPFDDEFMYYFKREHRYILRPDRADYDTGLILVELWRSSDNVEWYLEQVSSVVHAYVLKFKPYKYLERMQYYLAHSKKARKAIYRLMIDTIIYNHEDGGFLIAYQTGINLHEMKDIQLKIEHAVSVVGVEILKNFGLGQRIIGVNINDFKHFDTLEELLDKMLELEFIDEEQKDEIENIEDIPKSYKYRAFINPKEQYVLEDLLTFSKKMEKYGVDW